MHTMMRLDTLAGGNLFSGTDRTTHPLVGGSLDVKVAAAGALVPDAAARKVQQLQQRAQYDHL